ncbi:MAG: hypothetical protein MUE80_06755, partial [Acidobacteria bacterium]|nr:hypothetical protein [Acidobacteriota bacterium]
LALADRPGTFTSFKGRRLGVLEGRVLEASLPPGLGPGRVLSVGKPGVAVACGGGTAFLVERVQPEELSPGDLLGS